MSCQPIDMKASAAAAVLEGNPGDQPGPGAVMALKEKNLGLTATTVSCLIW